MFTRKIGKFLRGNATPAQVMMASILGSMLGFVPGFAQGPGLVVALSLLLLVLNANLFVSAMVGLVAKPLSLALLPVSFAVGRVLLDGPTSGLFKAAINAPVLALFGFEHYATTGGMAIGLAVGVAMGLAITALLGRFRRLMAGLDERSPKFVELSQRWWARVLSFVLVGGGRPDKAALDRMLARRVGNPIRLTGVILAMAVIGLLIVLVQFASEPIVTAALRRGLERANGATVDLDRAELDLAAGKLTVTGLAVSDPDDLSRNLLTTARVEADVSGADLLRKRLSLDRLVLVDASSGATRATPGRLVGPRVAHPPAEPGAGGKSLEEYLRDAQLWKDRLGRVRQWMEYLARREEAGGAVDPGRRAEELARVLGYARVRADHLIDGAPTFAIGDLLAEKVRAEQLPGETLDMHGRNLSTQPHLLPEAPWLLVESSGGTLRAEVGGGRIGLRWRGIPVASVMPQLAAAQPPLSGGTIDLEADGTWSGSPPVVDLPLTITVHDSTLTLPGAKPAPIQTLVLPVGVRGPLDNPRITLDDDALSRALVAAGAGELGELLPPELKDQGDAITKGLGDLLGGKKKDGG